MIAALAACLLATSGGGAAVHAAAGTAGSRPPFHAIAFVNDPLSHGQVGDALLSLNEAIRLHNGTLPYASLSSAEQAQLSVIPGTGGTTDVTWIDIDGGNTPTITIEQDLDPVLDTTFGLLVKGYGEIPTLDFTGANLAHGFRAPTNAITLEDLVLFGGPYGLDVTQTDVTGQPGAVCDHVRFEGQSQFGVRVSAGTQGGVGRVVLTGCTFVSVPHAVESTDTGAGRATIFELRDCEITGAVHGVRAAVGGGGGSARFTLLRSIVEASGDGVALALPATNGRPALIEGTHLRVRAGACVTANVSTDQQTWVDAAMWHLGATAPGGVALQLGSANAPVFGELRECTFAGDVTLAAGGAAQPLAVRNARARDGAINLSTSAGQPLTVTESRFDSCQVDAPGGGVTVSDSCFVGGGLGQASPPGALVATRCYVASPGPGVVASQPLPAPQLGCVAVSPSDAQLGGAIQLGVDLPAGLVALLVLGEVAETPPPLPAPFFVYVDLAQFVIVPGAYQNQQAFTWNVPNLFPFLGADFVAQALVLPAPGVQAPDLQLPPGWRFVLR